MTTINELRGEIRRTLKKNAPSIFAGFGIVGVAATGYLAARGAVEAHKIIEEHKENEGEIEDPAERFKTYARITWPYLAPAVGMGITTSVFIVVGQRSANTRTMAATAAYALTERAYNEYRERVVDTIGENKEERIRDEIAQSAVANTPNTVFNVGEHEVLCCELYTRRYFRSDMETLRRACNDINYQIIQDRYVVLDEFYERVGLEPTAVSSELGWDSDRLMELSFSTVLSDNNQPCIAFDYNYVKPI